MGVNVSVINETPYIWYFDTQERKGYTPVHPGCRTSYQESLAIHRYIYIRFQDHTYDSFSFEYNTNKGHTSFILSEAGSQIQLYCTSEGFSNYCPNYGKK